MYGKPPVAIPIIPNPVGADYVVSVFQKAFVHSSENHNGLPWLDVAYGIARRGEEKTDRRIFFFPEVYAGNREYVAAVPNDQLRSLCYFIVRDPQRRVNNYFIFDLSVIFWVNLQAIDNAQQFDYIFDTHLIAEVIHKIDYYVQGFHKDIKEIYSKDFEKIFKEYSVKNIDAQYMRYPYTAFRIEIQVQAGQACWQPLAI